MKPINFTIDQKDMIEIDIEIINTKPNKIVQAKTFDFVRKTNNKTCTFNQIKYLKTILMCLWTC